MDYKKLIILTVIGSILISVADLSPHNFWLAQPLMFFVGLLIAKVSEIKRK